MGATIDNGMPVRKRPLLWGLFVLGMTADTSGANGIGSGAMAIRSERLGVSTTTGYVRKDGRNTNDSHRYLLMLDDDNVGGTQAPTESSSQSRIAQTASPSDPPTDPPTPPPTKRPTKAPTTMPTEPPTLKPTEIPTARPTNEPTLTPSEAPTNSPSARPTNRPKMMSPTRMPVDLSFSQKAQQGLNLKTLAWALLIPVAAVSCIVWVNRNAKRKRRTIHINDNIVDGAIPNEILFSNEFIYPHVVEMASASTWRTSEDWDGTEQGTLPSIPSKEESYLTTDFDEME